MSEEDREERKKKPFNQPTLIRQILYTLLITSMYAGGTFSTCLMLNEKMVITDLNGYQHPVSEAFVIFLMCASWMCHILACVLTVAFYAAHPSELAKSPVGKGHVWVFGTKRFFPWPVCYKVVEIEDEEVGDEEVAPKDDDLEAGEDKARCCLSSLCCSKSRDEEEGDSESEEDAKCCLWNRTGSCCCPKGARVIPSEGDEGEETPEAEAGGDAEVVPDAICWRKRICNSSWICCSKAVEIVDEEVAPKEDDLEEVEEGEDKARCCLSSLCCSRVTEEIEEEGDSESEEDAKCCVWNRTGSCCCTKVARVIPSETGGVDAEEVPGHVDWRKRICNCSWICCSKAVEIEEVAPKDGDLEADEEGAAKARCCLSSLCCSRGLNPTLKKETVNEETEDGWRKRICNCSWNCCSKDEPNEENESIPLSPLPQYPLPQSPLPLSSLPLSPLPLSPLPLYEEQPQLTEVCVHVASCPETTDREDVTPDQDDHDEDVAVDQDDSVAIGTVEEENETEQQEEQKKEEVGLSIYPQ